MKRLMIIISLISLMIVPQPFYGQESTFKIPTSSELKKNINSPPNLISPSKLEPGLSKYRKPLPLENTYQDNLDAQKTLESIYKRLEWCRKNNSAKNWSTHENINMLMDFIEKYPDSRQAVTGKFLLGLVLWGDGFDGDTLPSYYWAIDLFDEVYKEFPNTWQGKLALYEIYYSMFFPVLHTEISWAYQYLDDYEASCLELEMMYLSPNKDSGLIEYEKFRTYTVNWLRLADAYCQCSANIWAKNNGYKEKWELSSQRIYQHMWDLCNRDSNYCPMGKAFLEKQIQDKKLGVYYGTCIPDEFK